MRHIDWTLGKKQLAAGRIVAAFADGEGLTIADVARISGVSPGRVGTIVRPPLYAPVGKRGQAVVWKKVELP